MTMKKIVSLMLIVFLVLGLTACSEEAENKQTMENASIEEVSKVDLEESSIVEETSSDEVVEETPGSEEKDSSEQEVVSTEIKNQILVVYFSVTGNTKTVAEKIASVTEADIYEIKAAVEYTDADINYSDSNSRTSKEQNDSSVRPEIKSEAISLEGYDTIYIGYPIWWGEEPRIMDTFVESYDFGDITMIPFCTSGSSGIGNSSKNLQESAESGNWLAGKRFDSKVTEDEIKEWISGL